MMQGILPKGYDVTRPIQGPDGQEWRAWSARLPQIGRTSHAADYWRELDMLQARYGHDEENTGNEGN